MVGYLVFGFMDAGNGVSAEMAAVDATYASSIVFPDYPGSAGLMLMLWQADSLPLLVSEMAGFVFTSLHLVILTPAELVAKDGLIANAFDGMLSSIIFILFIFVMVSLISEGRCAGCDSCMDA